MLGFRTPIEHFRPHFARRRLLRMLARVDQLTDHLGQLETAQMKAQQLPQWVSELRQLVTRNLKENKDLVSYALASKDTDSSQPRVRAVPPRTRARIDQADRSTARRSATSSTAGSSTRGARTETGQTTASRTTTATTSSRTSSS